MEVLIHAISAADTMTRHVLRHTWCTIKKLLPEQMGFLRYKSQISFCIRLLRIVCLHWVLQQPHGCHINQQPL